MALRRSLASVPAFALLVTLAESHPARAQAQCVAQRTTVAYHASGAPASADPLGMCRFDTGIRAMEPSFAFTADGRILYQGWVLRDEAPGGAPPYPVVLRSADGVAWEGVPALGPGARLDPS